MTKHRDEEAITIGDALRVAALSAAVALSKLADVAKEGSRRLTEIAVELDGGDDAAKR